MSAPRRMVDEGASPLTLAMLRASAGESAPPGARRRALAALGLEDGAPALSRPAEAARPRKPAAPRSTPSGRPLFDGILRGRPASSLRTAAAIAVVAHAAALALLLTTRGGPPEAPRPGMLVVDPRGSGSPSAPPVPFGPGMEPPRRLSGRDPVYTPEAVAARVQGVALVECVVTIEGSLTDCRLLRPVPHMEQAILESMATRRYTPVLREGQPVAVSYVFEVDLVLPG